MPQELISVIVPVYNVEKYLDECLKSLIQQTYENIEVIMVDDGSTDLSGDICDEYAKKYDNFNVIHKKNQGLGLARNTGLENATGNFVMFLDSDDYIDKTCISHLFQELKKENADMSKGGFKKVTNDKNIIFVREYTSNVFRGMLVRKEFLPRLIGSSAEKKDSIEMSACGTLYNMEIIKNNNIRFKSEREYISEDLIFNINYLQFAEGVVLTSFSEYNYRANNFSLTTKYRADRFLACKYFYIKVEEMLLNLGYERETIDRLKRMFFIYLRSCISQEQRKVSKKSKKESIASIKTICSDKLVNEIIKTYPKNSLGMKQNLFLTLIRLRMARTLYLLSSTGKI